MRCKSFLSKLPFGELIVVLLIIKIWIKAEGKPKRLATLVLSLCMVTKTISLSYWSGFGAVVAGLIFMLIRRATPVYMIIPIVTLSWEILRKFKILPRFKYLRYEFVIFTGVKELAFLW